MAGFGSLPLRRHAPTLGLLGDAQDLARGRGLARYGRAEAEVVEDAADGEGVGDEGDDAHALAAAGAEIKGSSVVSARDSSGQVG